MRSSGLAGGRLRPWLMGTLCLLLVAGGGVPEPSYAETVTPLKSSRDERAYRHLTLENRLRVLLISDPGTDKAAAALDVRVGSRHDPDRHLGLAHFLEHMLFLGTEKYPEAGAYQRFIQEHGGRHNATTGYEHTNYFFEIDGAHLEGALDRFAQFFIAPRFDQTYVERERHAVHSEYQARLKSDSSRRWDAMAQTFNPAHPLSRFTVGSLETLSGSESGALREALLEFWVSHYSANRMTLVVHGAQPLDGLQAWVQTYFSPIEDRDLPLAEDRVTAPLFPPGRLPALLQVEPERELRTLSLTFPVPSPLEHFRAKPVDYLSHLIGHEGEGSLLSRLKREGWSDALSSGLAFASRDAALFQVDVRLTERGLAHVPDVIGQVFQAVEAIRNEGPQGWRHREQARLLDLAFEFREPSSPLDYATDLARAMHVYPPREVLRGAYVLTEFEPDLIATYLERLTPQNMLAVLMAPDVQTDRRSPYYDAPYAIAELPAAWAEGWRRLPSEPPVGSPVTLPRPNEFIPGALALKAVESPQPIPHVLESRAGFTLVHRQDPSYRVPKANVYVSVRSPVANDTPRHAVLSELFVRLAREHLQEFTYPASLAGLDYDLYTHVRGFTLRVSGYDDKLGVLLERVVQTLRALPIDPARYAIVADDLARRLANERKERSFRLAMRELTHMLLAPSWTEEEKLAALTDVSPQALEAFVPRLLGAIDVVVLAHGNVTAEEARALGAVVDAAIAGPARPAQVPRGAVVRLDAGQRFRRPLEVDHQDAGIALYYQGRSRLTLERARFALLAQIVSSPFYFELRTRQQRGYVVFATGMSLFEVPGLNFVIQSPATPAAELDRHVRAFLRDYETVLGEMSDEEFARHRSGLLTRILETDKTLKGRSDRYWQEIDRGRFTFDSHERLASAVRGLDRPAFVAFYRDALLGEDVREIAVWALGSREREGESVIAPLGTRSAAGTVVSGPREFQRDKSFYRAP